MPAPPQRVGPLLVFGAVVLGKPEEPRHATQGEATSPPAKPTNQQKAKQREKNAKNIFGIQCQTAPLALGPLRAAQRRAASKSAPQGRFFFQGLRPNGKSLTSPAENGPPLAERRQKTIDFFRVTQIRQPWVARSASSFPFFSPKS